MKKSTKVAALISIASLFYSANLLAVCNLDRFRMGASYEDIRGKLGIPDRPPKASKIELPVVGERVCKNHKAFISAVNFTFLYDKLVQIEIRKTSSTPVVASWAESNYGVIKNKGNFFSNRPDALWTWETPRTVVTYSITKSGSDLEEYLQIQSSVHSRLFSRFADELEGQ